jgi:histidinol-phosphate aminotransferase
LLIPALSELGYPVTTTWANFLYCELGRDASSLVDSLYGLGIAVRGLELWGAPQAIRITIGTPEQNAALLNALRKLKNR